jgi:DNA-binding transcriptional MerR regulator
MAMTVLNIGEVAKRTGVTVETVRFYEKKGLIITPERSGSGYRQYPAETVKRVRFIQHAKEVGFTLKDIGELLALRREPGTSCADIKLRATEKIEEVDQKIPVRRKLNVIPVELIYEKTCPNIEAARRQLLRAFAEVGTTPRWQEWEAGMPETPAHVHGYGSPTILVDGRDVGGGMGVGHDYCCRVYSHGESGNKGVPALADVVHALRSAHRPPAEKGIISQLRLNAAMLPAFGAAFLPKLVCPACWPAYTGLLSALGIGFFDYTPYLLPLTAVFLLIAIAGLTYRAQRRRGYKPLLVGLTAAGILLIGKFYFDSDGAMYVGLALLVAASLWNTWPNPLHVKAKCPACVQVGQNQ